ncbi:DUF1853 family protein [Croceivirga sp. JEA036]|uniref:DUF1853 family protein n=1 Tax=Croceivirga sp. JEA036 TaxID=2721162 RepID=UPI00143966D2|nr:DUF1853 family protein [Croceivirga sp. JEA036]NJB35596.1 DUF1853 family protein [Croceivirga sp. JEA036]
MKELIQAFYNTKPLWTHKQFGLEQFEFPSIDMGVIKNVDIPEKLRLGHQMEYVFKHLITLVKNYQVIASNILIDEGKVRLGELDFILKDISSNSYLHVELAYKFYIINPDISEPIHRLMGPNKRDMFYTKLDKLKEKQFPLLQHPSLKQKWESLGIDPLKVKQQSCFKAQLFSRFKEEKLAIRPLNTACHAGYWVRFEQFSSIAFKTYQFYIPTKREWPLPVHNQVLWNNHYNTLLDINLKHLNQYAPMVWVRTKEGELFKLFVVWW